MVQVIANFNLCQMFKVFWIPAGQEKEKKPLERGFTSLWRLFIMRYLRGTNQYLFDKITSDPPDIILLQHDSNGFSQMILILKL